MTLLTKRHEMILMTLDKLTYASRGQLQRIFNLGSDRNAQRVLKNMSAYVNTIKRGQYVYYLNKKGREYVGSTNKVSKSGNIEHAILRNEIYIMYGQPDEWIIEDPIMDGDKTFIIPDVKFKVDGVKYLVEVDRFQTMQNNKKKIDKYAKIRTKIPMLIWIIENEHRKPRLERYLKEKSVNSYVVTKKDLVR